MADTLAQRIQELKKRRNAVILAHNYQPGEVQDIADFLGDSLDLSRKAAETSAEVIVFCGVHFMAETAALLSPEKTVLLPDITAGCPMADMLDGETLRALKRRHPGVPVVAYVNTTAEVKAETDVCCTSANAVKVVGALPQDRVIFVPDRNLGRYVAAKTGKEVILAAGFCPTHERILAAHVENARKDHPGAEVIVHPECTPDVVAAADRALSTSGMCRYARESQGKQFIVGTETGIIHRLRKENPDKEFYAASAVAVCPNMKKNTLEKVLWALEDMKHRVTVPEDIRARARTAIDAMLRYS
ncbi:MAG: quinolinate synthase NadA [Endomicrobiales bacterium]